MNLAPGDRLELVQPHWAWKERPGARLTVIGVHGGLVCYSSPDPQGDRWIGYAEVSAFEVGYWREWSTGAPQASNDARYGH
jgi:hypothetical protein